MLKDEVQGMKGKLFLKIIRDGEVIQESQDNLIVDNGRNALACLLGHKTDAEKYIYEVGVGTGKTAAGATDSSLTSPVKVVIKDIRVGDKLESDDGTEFTDKKVVQFHFVFGLTDAKDTDINEYGLFCKDGTLFSRVVRSSTFHKTAVDKIVGFWQISF